MVLQISTDCTEIVTMFLQGVDPFAYGEETSPESRLRQAQPLLCCRVHPIALHSSTMMIVRFNYNVSGRVNHTNQEHITTIYYTMIEPVMTV